MTRLDDAKNAALAADARRAQLAARRASLTPAKQALLEKWLRGQRPQDPSQSIPRRAETGPAPLSFAQQRLWFLDQLQPANSAYHISAPLLLRGQIDLAVLEQSLNEIVGRHEILRTRFVAIDGQPRQVIEPQLKVALEIVDLTGLSADRRLARARELGAEAARRPFDLARLPLVRMSVYRLAEAEHVVLPVMHHIVSDGWSIGVLVRELAAIYPARLADMSPPLAELPIQYADFAQWQRDWLAGDGAHRPADSSAATGEASLSPRDKQLDYWRRQLAGLPILELPTDFPRPAVRSFRGGAVAFALSAEVTQKLEALSRREGCTLFMTLLAAMQTLLCRYTGQSDVVVGSPHRQSQPHGHRGADRLLCQHAGAARRPLGQPELCRAACAHQGGCVGGIRASGPAV
jgi:hypothetical protein